MAKSTFPKFFLTICISVLFASSAISAFAHSGGGGHGGGGSHGGGGGGFHSGGGSFGGGFHGGRSAPPPAGAGASRPASNSSMRSGGAQAERSGSYGRYGEATGSGNQGAANSYAGRGTADGQWQSFGNASSGAAGGWHVFSGNRASGRGTVRSFSGDGNEIWETTPASRNVIPSSRALSDIRGSVGNSFARNSGLGTTPSRFADSRLVPGNMFGNRVRSYRGGCWNCGYGYGWWPGWGFGWGGLGFWGWDPFYWDSVGWGWPGYGYYGYPPDYPYGDNDSYDNGSYDNGYPDSAPPDAYPDQGYNSQPASPYQQNSPPSFSIANGAVYVLLYLKNGAAYSVRDYWLSGGRLHYTLLNGREGAIDADRLDLQRTVDENAKSGVQFILKPNANGFAPNPGVAPSTPNEAPPASSPQSTPQKNLAPEPEVHS